jgi:hypothetical protein
MKRLRPRLPSHTTVVAYLCLFLLLGGGAYAAQKIGSGQLKKNAVTTSKIKNGAVTTKKLKNGAVNGAKVADGSLTNADVNVASLPVTRIVQKMRGNATTSVPTAPSGTFAVVPLNNPTYTQPGDETDLFTGAADVTFQSTCTGNRSATAAVLVDSPDPTSVAHQQDIVAAGFTEDSTSGTSRARVNLGPYAGSRVGSGSATTHTVYLVITGTCAGGGGITASNAAVDVIGSR